MAWSLAKRGVRVAVLERARFPREKVCGDFIEPRGLRLFETMGCGRALEASSPLPITHVAIFLQSECAYRGRIPFYGDKPELPPYGYIVPREQLDTHLLDCARQAGAAVYESCAATEITRDGDTVRVGVRRGNRNSSFRARLVVGADGTRSTVARSVGLFHDDPRYIAVSQRAYVEGVSSERGEAAFFFDGDLFPGYGWMFPMSGGRANIGVGILSETRNRYDISVPRLFQAFVEKLRRQHPDCTRIRIVGKPLGGIVKTYGGAGPNYFDGGVLIGDAGCFVDPMTGEGITPAAESALIASSTVAEAVEQGRSDAVFLSRYERDFRHYFDPAMRYLDLCASIMRNRHLREFWLRAARRGCEEAANDVEFARVAGATFGGMEIRPSNILAQVWVKLVEDMSTGSTRAVLELLRGRIDWPATWLSGIGAWYRGWGQSVLDDPLWHGAWAADVLQKWTRLLGTLRLPTDPRTRGPLAQKSSNATAARRRGPR
jgi:geranylgeranyl reductase family protein